MPTKRQFAAAALLALIATCADAELVLDVEPREAPRSAPAAVRRAAAEAAEAQSVRLARSTLEVGCSDRGSAICRRADISVEVGTITRINQASGGVAIQETRIGSGR